MAKNQKSTVATGLDGLKDIVRDLKLHLPKLQSLPDLSGLATTVEGKIQAVGQIQEDVANALKFLDSVKKKIASYDNRLARKIVVSETAKDVAEMEEYISGVLELEDPIFRQVAATAYLKTVLLGDFTSYQEAAETLNDIEKRGILVKAGKDGPIMIGYQHYSVSSRLGMDKEDLEDISDVLAKFSRRLMGLVSQDRVKKTKELLVKANITLADVIAGKNGTCLLDVPPEMFLNHENQDKWRGGGSLMVEFKEKEIVPIAGVGSIEAAVKGMVDIGLSLSRYTFIWDAPPASNEKAFKRVQQGVMETLGFGEVEAETYVNKLKAFWWLIRRAVKAFQDKESMAKLKEEMSKKAEITPVEFFGLNGSTGNHEGTAFLAFKGAFQQAGQSEYNLFLLVANLKDEGNTAVEVKEVPEHLEKLLGEFVGKKYLVGEDFSGCPPRLGRILRGIRGQVDLPHEIAKE